MKAFVIDVSRCNGCYSCQIACKDEHVGNDWSPYAKPQPDTGAFWMKMLEEERGSTPKIKVAYTPVPCMHCDEAPCIAACPVKAIIKRPDGLVLIDPKLCNGCMNCLGACPLGRIYFNAELRIAQKCTGCAHLLDRKYPISEPRCVDICINGAIQFGEEADLKSVIAKAEQFHPEYKLKSRVYYLNLPKRFIAGTVFDPAKREIIKDATCTLTGEGGPFTAKTDGFGDFWFEGLKVGAFSLKIEAGGKSKTIDAIKTDKNVNLGDIEFA